MIPTLDVPTLPAPVRIPSTAPAKFPGWTPSPNNTPAPTAPATKTIKPFPFVPSEIWDAPQGKRTVSVWQVENSKCAMWRGAEALGLRRQMRGEVMYIKATLEDMARLLIWSWENK